MNGGPIPTLYLAGVNDHGKSCVVERRELTTKDGYFEAYRLEQAIVSLPASSPEAELLAAPTPPGGAVVNIFPWHRGEGTGMHRTITTDIDVVLQGSVTLTLEMESIELRVGDCAVLPAVAHAWGSGPTAGS